MLASSQAEVEKGASRFADLHDARQRQLRLEHTELAELHAQSSTALKSMAEHREALRHETEAHRRTQEQMVKMHGAMQQEREAYHAELAAERDARAQLPIVQAELSSTRKLLEQMGRDAAYRAAYPEHTHAEHVSELAKPPSPLQPVPRSTGSPSKRGGGGFGGGGGARSPKSPKSGKSKSPKPVGGADAHEREVERALGLAAGATAAALSLQSPSLFSR